MVNQIFKINDEQSSSDMTFLLILEHLKINENYFQFLF
jgi:hypothetical protein